MCGESPHKSLFLKAMRWFAYCSTLFFFHVFLLVRLLFNIVFFMFFFVGSLIVYMSLLDRWSLFFDHLRVILAQGLGLKEQ